VNLRPLNVVFGKLATDFIEASLAQDYRKVKSGREKPGPLALRSLKSVSYA